MIRPAQCTHRDQGTECTASVTVAGGDRFSALLLLPGALTVYLSFSAGGYFPVTVAAVVVFLAVILIFLTVGSRPALKASGRPFAIASGMLALYAAWVLASGLWSTAPDQALPEFSRALLYLLTFLAFGLVGGTGERLRWMVRGVLIAACAVCLTALIMRLLPELWPGPPQLRGGRMSYPVTYANALGLLAALGIVFATHTTVDDSEPGAARMAASAATPVLASTLYFTFSRGALASLVAALLVYAWLGRLRGLASTLLVTMPASAVAVSVAYRGDLLASPHTSTMGAVAQGRTVAVVIGVAALAAALLGWASLSFNSPYLRKLPVGGLLRRGLVPLAVTAGLAALVMAIVFLPHAHRAYTEFVEGSPPTNTDRDFRDRFTNFANNGRIELWTVALDGFSDAKLTGQGAGTFRLVRDRQLTPSSRSVTDAHSLYLETLGELGAVGLGLLLGFLLVVFRGLAARARGPDRSVYASVLAGGVAWGVQAGVDWMWELPAVTVWMFALAAAGIAIRQPVNLGLPKQPSAP